MATSYHIKIRSIPRAEIDQQCKVNHDNKNSNIGNTFRIKINADISKLITEYIEKMNEYMMKKNKQRHGGGTERLGAYRPGAGRRARGKGKGARCWCCSLRVSAARRARPL